MKELAKAASLPPHAEWPEAMGIVFVCFGYLIVGSFAMLASWHPGAITVGFSDNVNGGTLAFQLIMGAMALLLLWGRGYPLHLLYPEPSFRGLVEGLVLFACAYAASSLAMLAMPHYATTPITEMLAATHVTWPRTIPFLIVNCTYEEVFLLGYLMRGLRRFGTSTALGIALFVRMLYHTYQGPVGVVGVMVVGIVFSLYYLRRGGLFPVVLAHIGLDVLAFL